jgi:MSHA biogenesis protein MshP
MRRNRKTRQRGFSAIAAVAILVILASLATFIVTVSVTQQVSSALDVLGSKAYQASRAGIEWAAYQVLNPEDTNGSPETTPYACAATNIAGLGGGLGDFTVSVACSMTTHTEFGNTVRVYEFTATACNQPSAGACPNNASSGVNYVERQMTSVLSTCRQQPVNPAVYGASC